MRYTLYHATANDFNNFDERFITMNETDCVTNGFWFSDDKTTSCAWRNPKYLLTCELTVNNLISYNDLMELYNNELRSMDCNNIRLELIKRGYDGLLFTDSIEDININDGTMFETSRGSKHVVKLEDNYYCDYVIDKYGNEEYLADYATIEELKESYNKVIIVFESKNINVVNKATNKYWR